MVELAEAYIYAHNHVDSIISAKVLKWMAMLVKRESRKTCSRMKEFKILWDKKSKIKKGKLIRGPVEET